MQNVGGGQYEIDLEVEKTQNLKENRFNPKPKVPSNREGPEVRPFISPYTENNVFISMFFHLFHFRNITRSIWFYCTRLNQIQVSKWSYLTILTSHLSLISSCKGMFEFPNNVNHDSIFESGTDVMFISKEAVQGRLQYIKL